MNIPVHVHDVPVYTFSNFGLKIEYDFFFGKRFHNEPIPVLRKIINTK